MGSESTSKPDTFEEDQEKLKEQCRKIRKDPRPQLQYFLKITFLRSLNCG